MAQTKNFPHFSDTQMIADHFPDGVDIQKVDEKAFIEVIYKNVPAEMSEAQMENSPQIETVHTTIVLTELEPETGIYAAMSPITHRVYVYTSPEFGL